MGKGQALQLSMGCPDGLLIVTVQAREDWVMVIGPSKPVCECPRSSSRGGSGRGHRSADLCPGDLGSYPAK
ncbi:hypothetical protein GCM10027162_50650 [Streptomyces incanus]